MVNGGLRDHRLLFPWKPGGHQGAKVTLRLGLKVDTAAWMGPNVLEEPCVLETCVSIWASGRWLPGLYLVWFTVLRGCFVFPWRKA